MKCTTLGVDLAKSVFQLHGVDKKGQVVVQNRVTRSKLRATIAQLPVTLLALHASVRRLYRARRLHAGESCFWPN